jgi:hypothetical protein
MLTELAGGPSCLARESYQMRILKKMPMPNSSRNTQKIEPVDMHAFNTPDTILHPELSANINTTRLFSGVIRFIIYIALNGFFFSMAWWASRAGLGGMGNIFTIFPPILFAIFLFNRRICFFLAIIALFSGIVGPILVWSYGSIFIEGDMSAYGMLGTILGFYFIPIGIGLSIVGWLKTQ